MTGVWDMDYYHPSSYPYPDEGSYPEGRSYPNGRLYPDSRPVQPDVVSGNMRTSSFQEGRPSARVTAAPQRVDYVVGNSTSVHVEPLVTYSKEYPPLQRSASLSSSRRQTKASRTSRSSSLRIKPSPPDFDADDVEEMEAVDGCLVLGRQGPSFASYVTRYHVDRDEQREGLAREDVLETCLPCCRNSAKQTPIKFIMTVLMSEAFLFITHVLVLVLGIARVVAVDRTRHDTLHNVISSAELILTITNLAARFGLVRTMFSNLRLDITKLEHIEEGLSARGSDLRNWMWTYMVLTGTGILINLVVFIALHLTYEHNWTVLTNNVTLLSFAVSSRVFTVRVTNLSARIHADHLRVVLYESTLLLREGFLVTKATQRKGYRQKVDSFLNAFRTTRSFRKPGYIHLLRQHAPDWEKHSMGTETVTSC